MFPGATHLALFAGMKPLPFNQGNIVNFITFLQMMGLVLLGTFAHVLKLVVEERQTDQTFGLRDYFGLYPYRTGLMVLTAVGTAMGLFTAGELTGVTAFATGFIAQSIGRAAGNK